MTTAILIHFALGLISSFLGSLPFGTVNLSVVDTTVHHSFKAGVKMAIAAALVEIIQSFLAVHCGKYISNSIEMSTYVQIGVLVLMFALAIFFLLKKQSDGTETKKKWKMGNFAKGAVLGLINPQALPYWVFIITYFHTSPWFHFETDTIIAFLIGVSLGKLLALLLFGYLSLIIINRIAAVSKWMNKIIGGIFLLIGVVQGLRLLF